MEGSGRPSRPLAAEGEDAPERAVRAALADTVALKSAALHMTEALDDFGQLFDQRRRIVDAA